MCYDANYSIQETSTLVLSSGLINGSTEVNPLRCASTINEPHLPLGQPKSSSQYAEDTRLDFAPPPAKRKATQSPFKRLGKSPSNSGTKYNQPEIKMEKSDAQVTDGNDL